MLNLKFKERRLSTRKKLTGLLPGKIFNNRTEQPVDCRPVDISKDGVGVLSEATLKIDDKLTLKLPDGEISLKVMWKKQDYGKQNLQRYGLVTEDSSIDLEDIFMQAGCLK